MTEDVKNQNSEMSQWGIGPKMVLYLTPFIILSIFLDSIYYPAFLLPINRVFMIILGFILITIGGIILAKARIAINEAYRASELVTTGVYGYMRHPLYAAFILFITPGIVCLFNSWLIFFVPIVLYIIFRIMIKQEENYCLNKFGEKYVHYKKNVYAIIPKLRKYKSNQI